MANSEQSEARFDAALDQLSSRHAEIQRLVAGPEVLRDQNRYRGLMQEYSYLQPIMTGYQEYQRVSQELSGAQELLKDADDDEMADMARAESDALTQQKDKLHQDLRLLLVPHDPRDDKGIIMEIRAGTGGDEAALFAADLYRMYARYADAKGWKVEALDTHVTEIGGVKEVTFSISGPSVFEHLRWESGVHRVQRVPVTESGGRIHTSAVTVAVLPEAEETEVAVRQEDLRIDVYRSSGPGGQSVNTTDSAVRVTHLPTGLVVTCQDEKSQHKNRAKALRVLRARLLEAEQERQQQERAEHRRLQVGTGDRSERIRTYNFPQNRVTDHRINLTMYRLEQTLVGDLDELLHALQLSARERFLSGAS